MTARTLEKKPTPEQMQAADPDVSVWVTANAGAGKTHVLVDRVIRLMLEGAAPETILCLTYTKAAAAEMQTRLFQRLSNWALLDDAVLEQNLRALDVKIRSRGLLDVARQLFTRALETPGGLKIQTMHAFAERLLRLFPVEAGVAPGFRVLDDRDATLLLAQARDAMMRDILRAPESAVAGAFDILRSSLSESVLVNYTSDLAKDAHDGVTLVGLCTALGLDPDSSSIRTRATILQFDRTVYEDVVDMLKDEPSNAGFHAGEALRAVLVATDDDKVWDGLQNFALTKNKTPRKKVLIKNTAERLPDAAEFITFEIDRLADLFSTHDAHIRAEVTAAALVVAADMRGRFEHHKAQQGLYSFADLIERAAALLTQRPNAQWVLYKLDRGLNHILVDEAQDTSPLQWRMIEALADEFFSGEGPERKRDRTLFVVGDRKQSIYSFQGANAANFETERQLFADKTKAAQRRFPPVRLALSYRTVTDVLDFVDEVFPAGSHVAMGFSEPDGADHGHASNRNKERGVVEVWPLLASLSAIEPVAWTAPVDRVSPESHRIRLAAQLAQTIKSWIGHRLLQSKDRTVEPGDILILLQKRGPLFDALIAALRKAGVPVAGADRLTLNESLVIHDLVQLGEWLLLPEDDHGLACVLKSPLVPDPLDDEDLFQLAHDRGTLTLLQRLQASPDTKAQRNALYLDALRHRMVRLGPYDFFSHVLAERRRAIAERLGPEALDASNAFLELAIAFEQEHSASLAGFLAWFNSGETQLKREMEQGSNDVRLMTVHGSKGLEANIVILPDTADKEEAKASSFVKIPRDGFVPDLPVWSGSEMAPHDTVLDWKEQESALQLQEKKRLLYVAMTRARDELYICGSSAKGESAKNSWYRFIGDALARPDAKIEMRSVIVKEDEPAIRRHGVDPVWRDQSDDLHGRKTEDFAGLPTWIGTALPMSPPLVRKTVTAVIKTETFAPFNDSFSSEGARYGIAVHTLMKNLPSDNREAYATSAATRLGIHVEAAVQMMRRIEAPDAAPFFADGSMAEVEILSTLPSGELLAGRMDRLRIADDGIYLMDYKTDAIVPADLHEDLAYVQQISLYSRSVGENHPGVPLTAAIYWTASGRIDFLTPELITRACDLAVLTAENDVT